MRDPYGPRPLDEVSVVCWCEANVAKISTADMLAGRTWSCDNPGCAPPDGVRCAQPIGRVRRRRYVKRAK